jgi:hypothetical protein
VLSLQHLRKNAAEVLAVDTAVATAVDTAVDVTAAVAVPYGQTEHGLSLNYGGIDYSSPCSKESFSSQGCRTTVMISLVSSPQSVVVLSRRHRDHQAFL